MPFCCESLDAFRRKEQMLAVVSAIEQAQHGEKLPPRSGFFDHGGSNTARNTGFGMHLHVLALHIAD